MDEKKTVIDARVVSATELTTQQAAELSGLLRRNLGSNIVISQEVDETLIGGLFVYVNGVVVDFTVKKRINDMKESVLRGGS